MNLSAVVFSCDRPAQLELFLRTFRQHAQDFSDCAVSVLFKATTDGFRIGYDQVVAANPDVVFFEESDEPLKLQIGRMVARVPCDFSAFFVDDDVLIRDFSVRDPEFKCLAEDPNVLALSLRLHPFVFYCQPLGCFSRPPLPLLLRGIWNELLRRDGRVSERRWSVTPRKLFRSRRAGKLWRKVSFYPRGDWQAWWSVDGNVFRTARLQELLLEAPEIESVTELEGALAACRPRPQGMICYSRPQLVNQAMNRVDRRFNYPCMEVCHHGMNDRFLGGERLDDSHLTGRRFKSCHLVTEPVWISGE